MYKVLVLYLIDSYFQGELIMLTRKQFELLMFINERIKETGVSPSFDEMKVALNLKSKSGIHRLITALEERGFIHRLAHRARALEIIKLPENASPSVARQKGFNPTVIEGSLNEVAQPAAVIEDPTSISVPIMGTIAAGVPITAIQDHSNDVTVPIEMLANGDHFALEVSGDSMIEAGILDGDTVIIKQQSSANNGDIVVALIDNEEATLKRLRKKGDSIALEAANPAFETRIFGPDRVTVQGKLVGLIRRY